MIGADELTVLDKHWNVAFSGSQRGVERFVEQCRQIGFTVKGDVVHATKRELEVAFARPGVL